MTAIQWFVAVLPDRIAYVRRAFQRGDGCAGTQQKDRAQHRDL